MERVMVIQLARMGDLIQTIPLLQALKTTRQAEIILAVDKRTSEIAEQFELIDRIIPLDFQSASLKTNDNHLLDSFRHIDEILAPLREGSYDRLYNLNHSPLNFAAVSQVNCDDVQGFIFTDKAGGFKCSPSLRILFNQSHHRRLARVHISDLFRYLIDQPPNMQFPLLKPDDTGLNFALSYMEKLQKRGFKRFVALHLSAGADIRLWGAEKFAYTAAALNNYGEFAFIIIGNETLPSRKFRESLPDNDCLIDLTGKTNIKQLTAVLSQVDLMIGADSGPLQLASALGTKTLGLYFASASLYETGPLGNGHIVIQAMPQCWLCDEDNPECDDFKCRQAITPDLVANVALKALNNDEKTISKLNSLPEIKIFTSQVDDLGQAYIPVIECSDGASFYRRLWLKRLKNNFQIPETAALTHNPEDIDNFENNLRNMAKNPLMLPLVHHYYYVKADEGAPKAMIELERLIAIAADLNPES